MTDLEELHKEIQPISDYSVETIRLHMFVCKTKEQATLFHTILDSIVNIIRREIARIKDNFPNEPITFNITMSTDKTFFVKTTSNINGLFVAQLLSAVKKHKGTTQ